VGSSHADMIEQTGLHSLTSRKGICGLTREGGPSEDGVQVGEWATGSNGWGVREGFQKSPATERKDFEEETGDSVEGNRTGRVGLGGGQKLADPHPVTDNEDQGGQIERSIWESKRRDVN